MAEYVNEEGRRVKDEEGTKREDASKASFKLNLIETVDADPLMQPSDLKLLCAYLAKLNWPNRRTWLSISHARARTNLSERQVIASRARLCERGYLIEVGTEGSTKIFRAENPRHQDMMQHIAIMTAHYRDAQKQRQAERRRLQKSVPANNAGTEEAMSHSPSACDVPANNAGNIPSLTPQEESLKKGNPNKVSSVPSYGDEDSGDYAFPIPANVAEGERMLDEMLSGTRESDPVRRFFRQQLFAGEFMKSTLDAWRNANAA